MVEDDRIRRKDYGERLRIGVRIAGEVDGKNRPFCKTHFDSTFSPGGCQFVRIREGRLGHIGMLSWPPGAKANLSGLGRQPSVSPIDRNAIRPAPLTDSERFTYAIKLCSNVGVPLDDFSV